MGLLTLAIGLGLVACSTHPRFTVPDMAVGDRQFSRLMEAHTHSTVIQGNDVRLLLNGDQIFPAMLDAIRGARQTITFANYLYEDGQIAEEMAEAFAERCRAGVAVHVLLDAAGSKNMPKHLRARMQSAGCAVEMFRPLTEFTIRRVNKRNHRRILIADGHVAVVGGIGIGDRWTGDGQIPNHWRQTDVLVKGPLVHSLQAAFAESWRETTGVLLGGADYFPDIPRAGALNGQAIRSSPVAGAAEAYLVFLLAIEGARSSIMITSPYFIPDGPMMDALARAVERGVRVSVLTAGEATTMLDRIVRKAGQARFGRALSSGIRIWEYRGGLLHAKTITVDGRWSTVGSANLDRRSFAINHELNVVFDDSRVAHQLEQVFANDLQHSREVTLDQWRRRGLGRLFEAAVFPLRDQL